MQINSNNRSDSTNKAQKAELLQIAQLGVHAAQQETGMMKQRGRQLDRLDLLGGIQPGPQRQA